MATRTDKTKLIRAIDAHLRDLGPEVEEHAPTIIAGLDRLKGDSLEALRWALYEVAKYRREVEAVNGDVFSPEKIRSYLKQATQILMPWEGGGHSPINYIRQTASGRRVAEVTSWLGGFGNCSRPRYHGWGYRGSNPAGQGACTSGIVAVEWNESMSEDEIRKAEIEARDKAMKIVDDFYAKEFPSVKLLHEEVPPFYR